MWCVKSLLVSLFLYGQLLTVAQIKHFSWSVNYTPYLLMPECTIAVVLGLRSLPALTYIVTGLVKFLIFSSVNPILHIFVKCVTFCVLIICYLVLINYHGLAVIS